MALPKDDSLKTLNGKLVNVEGMTIGSFPETAMFWKMKSKLRNIENDNWWHSRKRTNVKNEMESDNRW